MITKENLFRPHEILTQRDNQTCLLCCLLMARSALFGENLNFYSLEKELYHSSFGLYPSNFMLGRCAAFTQRFPDIQLDISIDNEELTNDLRELSKEPSIQFYHQEITANWIMESLSRRPMTVYVDQLHLGGDVHSPHFIYLYKNDENVLNMVDPAFGQDKILQPETLHHALMGLKYQMLWSPLVIAMEKS